MFSISQLKQENFVTELLNSYSNPVLLLDRNYQIIATNEAYQLQYGYQPDSEPKHCYEISHRYNQPCDLAGESCPLKLCLESNSPQRS